MARMMHIVLIRIRPDADPARVAEYLEATRALQHQVEGIESLSVGADVLKRDNNPYTHAAVFVFRDRKSLEGLRTAPAQLYLRNELNPAVLQEATSIDMEL